MLSKKHISYKTSKKNKFTLDDIQEVNLMGVGLTDTLVKGSKFNLHPYEFNSGRSTNLLEDTEIIR